MRFRAWSCVFVIVAWVGGVRSARAEGDEPAADEHAEHHEAAPAEEHHEEAPPAEEHAAHHEEAPAAEAEEHAAHHEQAPAETEEHAGHHEDAEHHEEAAQEQASDDDGDDDDADAGAKYDPFDPDGDGHEDPELKKEYQDAFQGIPANIDEKAVDEELDERPTDKQLLPSITVDQFRKAVRAARKVVLDRMEKKMAKAAGKKIAHFATGVFIFSLLGLLLLFVPLFVGRKYPGKTGVLFKYSGLAALVFFLTVNLFGGVLVVMRTTQAALGTATNPSLAIAAGTFDTLDRNAEEYITMGKELFVPTLEQLRGNSDEQPSVLLLENGQKVIQSAKVFVGVAKMFKKLDFIFKILPIVLFGVTMILFGLAIRPTLTEIIKLPMRAAAGEEGIGREVTRKAMRRVWGELLVAVCTIAVLAVLTVLSGFVLGEIVSPALDALLGYFSRAVTYLQFVEGASSGLVFLTLFAVILFLVLNVAALIVSMSFFLGKCQKIFQAKFNEGTPIRTHARFFKLGIPAVLFVQLFPWLYAFVADKVLLAIDHSLLDGVTDASQVSWHKLLLAGPAFLVLGFVLLFWAARGFKAIGFLAGYKVKPKAEPAPGNEDTHAV
jgi:hypothetical protein